MDIFNIFIQAFSTIFEQKIFVYILIFFIAIILLKFFLKIGKRLSIGKVVYEYKPIGFLFSKAEYTFYLVLQQALSDQYDIFAKVRIADVLSPAKGLNRKNWRLAFNSISSKHFDYVLCDKDSSAIAAVIELDDKSHFQRNVKKRDSFVEKACESANLNLFRFRCASDYHVEDIQRTILNGLSK